MKLGVLGDRKGSNFGKVVINDVKCTAANKVIAIPGDLEITN